MDAMYTEKMAEDIFIFKDADYPSGDVAFEQHKQKKKRYIL